MHKCKCFLLIKPHVSFLDYIMHYVAVNISILRAFKGEMYLKAWKCRLVITEYCYSSPHAHEPRVNTNYSNISCLDTIVHTEVYTIFSLDLNFARWLVACPLLL